MGQETDHLPRLIRPRVRVGIRREFEVPKSFCYSAECQSFIIGLTHCPYQHRQSAVLLGQSSSPQGRMKQPAVPPGHEIVLSSESAIVSTVRLNIILNVPA